MASAIQVQVDVHSLRSAQLQIELKRRGLSSSGKKSELRRRLEEALKKERDAAAEKATASSAQGSVEVAASNAEESSTQQVQNTTMDSSISDVQNSPAAAKEVAPTNETKEILSKENTSTDIVTDKKETGNSTGDQPEKESTTSQDNKETSHDKDGPSQTALQDSTQVATPQDVEDKGNSQSAAEVSMEADELVVHTVDEDDFKIEEQSRSQVSKKKKRKSGELPTGTADERNESDAPAVKKRKINLQGSVGTPSGSSERKRKWKSSSSKMSATSISSDVLKKIIPDSVTKEVTSEDVFAESDTTRSHDPITKSDDVDTTTKTDHDDIKERERMRLAEEETRRRIEVRLRERQDGELLEQQRRSDVSEGDLAANKEVIVDYNQAIRVRSPITNRSPASCILHVANLVRPFAQCQLKELLTEDGALVDGGFWINKIKSHCFAVYESLEVAIATRNRLDGVKWPVTNPKVLSVEFADEDKVVTLTDGALSLSSGVTAEASQPHPPKVEEKPQQNTAVAKETTQTAEQPSKQQEGEEDVTNKSAVNRLDELFKKTIAAPQIYWLPLTSEEGEKRLAAIKAEEEERRQRREQRRKEREEKEKLAQEEREKRMKEREEERQQRRRRRSGSTHRSRSRSRHRSHSKERRSK
ncbi:apoptotic chromatin condensation inducer in the nucleus-like [Dysidea avara]|uniref:apoptotic chromatin condensation inducer in the nucleus-like n=1 Tax=Dysidea avara TaxID=196820 RepID=UPI00332F6EB0